MRMLSFDQKQIEALFPFLLILDEGLKIVDCGGSMQKIFPNLIGETFQSQFVFRRPFSVSYDLESIKKYLRQVFIFQSLDGKKQVFKGQFIWEETPQPRLIWVGNPWITNVDALKDLRLTLLDFPLYDNIVEILQFFKSQETMMQDLRALAQHLEDKNALLNVRNKQLTEFASIISHNLRGPIVNLNLLVDMFEEEPENYTFLVEQLTRMSKNLLSTIDDVADVLRNKDVDIVYSDCQFEDAFQKALEVLDTNIRHQNAQIQADFQAAPYALAYPVYLDNVFYNLISNALKYASPERRLVLNIRSWQDENRVYLAFEDNGLGIDLTRHGKNIFKMYKTFHKNKDAKGLGLYLVRTQVEVMGGTIDLKSTLHVGTTFTLSFKKSE